MIAPLAEREESLRQRLDEARARTQAAQESLQEIPPPDAQMEAAREELERLQEGMPSRGALVWLPERVRKHFKDVGFGDVSVQANTSADVPELPGFLLRRCSAVRLPCSGENSVKSCNASAGGRLTSTKASVCSDCAGTVDGGQKTED